MRRFLTFALLILGLSSSAQGQTPTSAAAAAKGGAEAAQVPAEPHASSAIYGDWGTGAVVGERLQLRTSCRLPPGSLPSMSGEVMAPTLDRTCWRSVEPAASCEPLRGSDRYS